MTQIATFTFDSLSDAATTFVKTPNNFRAKLTPADCTIRTEIGITEALASALKAEGVPFKVTRTWLPLSEAWA